MFVIDAMKELIVLAALAVVAIAAATAIHIWATFPEYIHHLVR
jgi:hypothetical protein